MAPSKTGVSTTARWLFRICHLSHQLLETWECPHHIPMRVRFEVAQHGIAFPVSLFEAIQSLIVVSDPGEDEGQKIRWDIRTVFFARFEHTQAFGGAS